MSTGGLNQPEWSPCTSVLTKANLCEIMKSLSQNYEVLVGTKVRTHNRFQSGSAAAAATGIIPAVPYGNHFSCVSSKILLT